MVIKEQSMVIKEQFMLINPIFPEVSEGLISPG
jgi:hypothetical protein